MLSDVSTGLEVVGDDAIAKLQEVCQDLQRKFGQGGAKTAVMCSSSASGKRADLDLFFQSEIATSAIFNNCTCAVIKPHVVSAGQAGQVIDTILAEGFEISALQMFNLDKPTAEEFLEIYKGVVPEYIPICEQMTTGASIVMEIRQ